MAKFFKNSEDNGEKNKGSFKKACVVFVVILLLISVFIGVCALLSANADVLSFTILHPNEVRSAKETYEVYHQEADKQFLDALRAEPGAKLVSPIEEKE